MEAPRFSVVKRVLTGTELNPGTLNTEPGSKCFVKSSRKLILLLGLLLLSLSLTAQNPSSFDAAGEAQVFADLNQSRAEAGVPPLKLDPKLTDAARRHALLLPKHHVLSHQFSGEPPLTERLRSTGLIFTAAAENVGMNTELSDVNDMFMRSPGHRANMLNAAYDAVGIGVVHMGPNYWVTEDFAKLTPSLSGQQAEDEAAASFESKWKATHSLVPKRVNVEPLRTSACQSAKSGGKSRGSAFSYEGKLAQEVVGFSIPDPSALAQQVDSVMRNANISAYAVGACTPEQSGDPGLFWIVMAFSRRGRRPWITGPASGFLRERIFIRTASVDDWHRHIQQTQVDRELSAMVVPVVQHDRSQHCDARQRERRLAPDDQRPVLHCRLIAHSLETSRSVFAALLEGVMNFLEVLRRRRYESIGVRLELVLVCHNVGHSSGDACRMDRQLAEAHRFRMRLPGKFVRRNPLQHAPGRFGFLAEFVQHWFSHLRHVSSLLKVPSVGSPPTGEPPILEFEGDGLEAIRRTNRRGFSRQWPYFFAFASALARALVIGSSRYSHSYGDRPLSNQMPCDET